MRFVPLSLPGPCLVETEPFADERGAFARLWCRRAFAAAGLDADFVQANASFNPVAGTLRGLHWQAPPHGEAKLVRCVRGRIHDIVVDVRPDSPGFGRWAAVTLEAADGRSLYVPEGFAHGFQTLIDDVEVDYQVSAFYAPAAARGVRWDDPALAIAWPMPPTRISVADRSWPALAR
ncbi:MAG: dTDP-4-dehydrorhamnose 3,5-epimerase [Alphaproteobacteria bacterium]|nr:dTDP-4-dehydrorhamnose 3,5-epimerase [Alphaproteobacteria bacterium]